MTAHTSRRRFVAGTLAGAAVPLWPNVARARPTRRIPQRPAARVIIDNDFAGDPDGLVALAHQLLSPKTRTTLITASRLDDKLTPPDLRGRSAAAGRDVAVELVRRVGMSAPPPVVAGAERGDQTNAAARAIVAEALRDDPLPLIFTYGGPLTNLAAALQLDPSIAGRMRLIWMGGGGWPDGGWEYNLATDVEAARHVIERSALPIWQVPLPAYRQMQYPVAALEARMRRLSRFGAWLYDRFTTPPDFIEIGGSWPLGDSPLVLLSAITTESCLWTDRPARRINADLTYGAPVPDRTIRVFEQLDPYLTFEDFLSLMELHARR